MDFTYPLTGIVTIVSLLIYVWMAMQIGKARGQHSVPAPSTDGPEDFLRVLRVHGNTMEGLILFIPALWLFALTIGDIWAALVGVAYPIGRLIYARGYYAAADKRSTGFLIGFVSTIILLLGSLGALIMATTGLYL
ncbi:MAG: MAPEG domain-containing protein [Rhodobiaceae bacterium]|nr:MAG: MAPEG domain-containing protein [Rhodobiaceae bacterium]